jgi:hypothetical protein
MLSNVASATLMTALMFLLYQCVCFLCGCKHRISFLRPMYLNFNCLSLDVVLVNRCTWFARLWTFDFSNSCVYEAVWPHMRGWLMYARPLVRRDTYI